MQNSKLTRINKFLSEIGYCSRRAADKLINERRVSVNNKIVRLGVKVSLSDEVRVDGEKVFVSLFSDLSQITFVNINFGHSKDQNN